MEAWLRDSKTRIGIAKMEMNLEQLKCLSYIKDNVGHCSILKYDKEVGNDVIVDYKIDGIETTFSVDNYEGYMLINVLVSEID